MAVFEISIIFQLIVQPFSLFNYGLLSLKNETGLVTSWEIHIIRSVLAWIGESLLISSQYDSMIFNYRSGLVSTVMSITYCAN